MQQKHFWSMEVKAEGQISPSKGGQRNECSQTIEAAQLDCC